jgi:hypothetical protein
LYKLAVYPVDPPKASLWRRLEHLVSLTAIFAEVERGKDGVENTEAIDMLIGSN